MPSTEQASGTASRRSTWRAVVGALWIAVPLVIAAMTWSTLLAGHPAYPVTLTVVVLVGVALLLSGLRRGQPDAPLGRRRVLVAVGRVLGAVGTAVVLGSLIYLIPLGATSEAVAATASDATVSVDISPTRIVLTPRSRAALQAGLVFQPGAKVDPRAYLPLLTRVAAAGYLVVIVKQPYDIGFLSINDPANVINANPSVTRWAVGGHSLGGVAAATYAASPDSHVRGLLFWASYPLGSLAGQRDLVVASVSGTADGLSTPADIEASRANLPVSTTFTEVQGGVHAFFGDYGAQPGDGTPTTDRATAQQLIVTATTAFMAKVAAAG